ncbi:244_t:CDS:2 [Entrophospora sp. SA101]|nr:5145_t:CDS:2 [Entrophospora candida]CAJ0831571.1 244_t:CDS:2 [Entrophospora sp. SA101]CAJ0879936.1 10729_t:CDS:2 [Entrophospora sp. SA101]
MASKEIFVVKGVPLVFYVKFEVPDKNTLEQSITEHGGKTIERPSDAQWILADPLKIQSAVHKGKTRTEFTLQDDLFLEHFLITKADNLRGRNDRHTWESWRHRAVRFVIPRMEKKGMLDLKKKNYQIKSAS